ncbi:peptidase [uncultured Tenacibaculum sp.]|uniref:peptidase n=1 Tax=uncultured Tenacibaculum sp. TaxID=174713 RepID=UPI002605E7C0|nr:peptidase [uncultured Tenacibaculum sp.]
MFTTTVKSTSEEDISILIQKDNHSWNYLCDCGEASGLTVKEIQNVKAVFISHTHIDHFINFDAIIRHQIGTEEHVIICGPKGIAAQVQSKLQGYTWNLINEGAITYEVRELLSENYYEVYELKPAKWELEKVKKVTNNFIFEDKDFHISCVMLDHKIQTVAYRFQEREKVKIDIKNTNFKPGKWVKELKEAFESDVKEKEIRIEDENYKAEDLFYLLKIEKGDSLGIIMDHAASEENHIKIKTHFSGCKNVYIESFYLNEDKDLAEKNFHSYAAKSGEIMKRSEIENPIPVHFSRKYKEEQRNQLQKEFYTAFQETKIS